MMKDLVLMVLGMIIPGLLIYILKLKRTDSKKDDAISEVLQALTESKAAKAADVSSARIDDANARLEQDLKDIENIKLKGANSPVAEAMKIAKDLVKDTSASSGTQCIDVADDEEEEEFYVPSSPSAPAESPSSNTELPDDLKAFLSKQAIHMKEVMKTDEEKNDESAIHHSGNPAHRHFFH